ncbi:MAG TPA: amino acid deaminase/aldolase [Chloroflexia bacterium]
MSNYETYKAAFQGRQMPFAYVDLDLLDANIRQIVARAGGKPIRVASKSIRSLPILQHILAADPALRGVLCFTAPEAVYLSRQGLDDLVIGYPIWHPAQIAAVCAQVRQGKTIVAMVDSREHVAHLEAIACAQGVVLPVCLDIDLSTDFPGLHFGVWRSSIFTPRQALAVYRAIAHSPHLRLDGLMGYEAQIAGVGDQVPGQRVRSALIRALKRRSIAQIAERRARTVALLARHGARLRFVNGGGTGSLESTRAEPCVTEVTAGSGFFAPALFDHYRAFRHAPAAGFAVEIVRKPKPGIYTCSGGGYIASGATGPEKQPQPYLPPGARLLPLEGAGEVQTPVAYQGPVPPALGDPIFLRHSKAGELCERFNTLLLLRQGRVVDEVPTYRGAGLCFL